MSEYIVFVKIKKNNRIEIGTKKLNALNGPNAETRRAPGEKVIYFERKKNIRAAMAAESKFKLLTRNRLIEKIRYTNPELLDLKHTIFDSEFLKESNY
jgi:predicted GIY-YIG superfamily endonuclease